MVATDWRYTSSNGGAAGFRCDTGNTQMGEDGPYVNIIILSYRWLTN
jgi:hypothetical protein